MAWIRELGWCLFLVKSLDKQAKHQSVLIFLEKNIEFGCTYIAIGHEPKSKSEGHAEEHHKHYVRVADVQQGAARGPGNHQAFKLRSGSSAGCSAAAVEEHRADLVQIPVRASHSLFFLSATLHLALLNGKKLGCV